MLQFVAAKGGQALLAVGAMFLGSALLVRPSSRKLVMRLSAAAKTRRWRTEGAGPESPRVAGKSSRFSSSIASPVPSYGDRLPAPEDTRTTPLSASAAVVVVTVAGATTYLLTGVMVLGFLVLPVALLGLYSSNRRSKNLRLLEIRRAWPEALRHMASMLESGDSVGQCIGALASQGPKELRTHFERCARRYRATGDLDSALALLEAELGYRDFSGSVRALRLAINSGGSELIEVLKTAADIEADRFAAEREVHARQSWTVTAARAAAASPWIVLALMLSKPQTAAVYRTALGNIVVGIGAATTFVGYVAMKLIGRVSSASP
jgi:tight adherence protein B